jgi:hypothetical protein
VKDVTITESAAIGEIFASIAVLITLIFLVVQMRQNTLATRRANVSHTWDRNSEALVALLDEGVSEIFIKGLKSLDSLSEVQRYRFDVAFYNWLSAVEQAFLDSREGMHLSDQLVAFENSVPGFLGTPGGKVWWEERQIWFSRAFRADVERLCAQPPGEATGAGPKLSTK